jgi:hypothetical protein
MFRMVLGVGSAAILILTAAGCQMCCHPYDKSGPVFCGDGCSSSPCSRAGSIFAGNPGPSVVAETPAHQKSASPSPTPAEAKKQRAPASRTLASHRPNSSSTHASAKKPQKAMSYVMADKRVKSPSPTPTQTEQPQESTSGMVGRRPEGPLLGSAQPGDVPGSERIVSITERVTGPSADSPQDASEASPTPSRPSPANGWTARRPTIERLR